MEVKTREVRVGQWGPQEGGIDTSQVDGYIPKQLPQFNWREVMAIWEYKSVTRPYEEALTDEQLSKIGSLGFELVSVLPVTAQVIVVGRQEQQIKLHYFFKRSKSDKGAG
jgi:hypothetical protein